MANPVLECAIDSNINDARSPRGSQGFDIESNLIAVIDSNNHKLTISQGLCAWWGGGLGAGRGELKEADKQLLTCNWKCYSNFLSQNAT